MTLAEGRKTDHTRRYVHIKNAIALQLSAPCPTTRRVTGYLSYVARMEEDSRIEFSIRIANHHPA